MNPTKVFSATRRKFLERLENFNESSDFFVVPRYFVKLFAIHSAHVGWRQGRVLWYLYRALYGLIYFTYVYKAYWVLSHWESNRSSATNILGVLWYFSAVILRVGIIDWHYPLLTRMQDFLNDHSYRRSDPWTTGKRSKFYRRSNRIAMVVMAVVFGEIVCFAATNVLTLEDFMLQYQGRPVGQWPVQITYGVLTMLWGAAYCLGFLICYQLMATFEMEIDVLLHSLEELGQDLGDHSSVPSGSDDAELFWNGLIDKLRPCIHRLTEISDNLDHLKVLINPIAFVQYYSTYLVIADCCLILATGGMSTYCIVYIISMLVFLTEAYLLCHGIENLRNLKPCIASALYDFDWTLQLHKPYGINDMQYRHVRHTFLLITAHSGQMLRFSFAGIGEISMNSFSELLEKSYSMLTFLLQFAK